MTPPPTILAPLATSLTPSLTTVPASTNWWASADFWTIVAGVVAVVTLAGTVMLWAARAVRQRRALQSGVHRRCRRGRGPVVRNDWPSLSPRFTGRADLLGQLQRQLSTGRPVVLYGLGGVGKTQTVLAYLQRHQNIYQVIWWVRAEQAATLTQDLARLAQPLGLPEEADPDQTVVVGAVRRWLATHGDWLLVLDNATTEHAVADLLPAQPLRGEVLLTSRSQLWPDATAIHVHPWTGAESLAFLRASVPAAQRVDETSMAALANELGNLPIALEQASAYLHAAPRPLDDYLRRLRAEPGHWLDIRGLPDDERTVAKTWGVALDELRHTKGAQELLTLCAFLAPNDIPLELFSSGATLLPEPLREVAVDPGALDRAVIALRRYSFVTVTDDSLEVHRLVQAVTRHPLPEAQANLWAGIAVEMIAGFFPPKSDDVRYWTVCERLLPHALTAAEHAERMQAAPERTSWLLDRAATYLESRARLTESRGYMGRALAITEAALGSDHPDVAIRRSNLGRVLSGLGDLRGAREQLERSLAVAEAAFDPDDPAIATLHSNLGAVLARLGDLQGAREQLEGALAIGEVALGRDHPEVAIRRSNLGSVLADLGDLQGARLQLEEALAISEVALGPDHPDVAIRRSNLGTVLTDIGDLQGAREQLEGALAISQIALGPGHPEVATVRSNFGMVLTGLGDLQGAREQLKEALAITEAALGPDHPDVAIRRSNLGGVLKTLGDLRGAREQQARALAISKLRLGPDHPTTRQISANLADVDQASKEDPS